jgi:hypothetical protein
MPPPTEESLVHEVIEDSSDSDTATDPPPSPCKIRTVHLVSLFILLAFVLPESVLPFIGFSAYFSAKSGDLPTQYTYYYPVPMVLVHILTVMIGFCAAFFGLMYHQDCCVFSEQFPSGGRTTSSKDPPPSASIPECSLSTHSPPCR